MAGMLPSSGLFGYGSNMKTRLKRVAYFCIFGAVIAICSEQPSCATPIPALSPVAAEWKLASPPVCSQPVPAELRTWSGTT